MPHGPTLGRDGNSGWGAGGTADWKVDGRRIARRIPRDWPREFDWGIVITFGFLAGLSLLFFGDTWAQRKANVAFFLIFGTAAKLMRLSMRNVITVTGAEIEVLH
jgi:hypothetical protein